MARNSALHGSRIGSGPKGVSARGDLVERVAVTFWCANGHTVRPQFAATAPIPDTWDCHVCDLSAGRDPDSPPSVLGVEAHKTHLACVRARRSDADAEVLLAEALARLRSAC